MTTVVASDLGPVYMRNITSLPEVILQSEISASYGNQCNSDVPFVCVLQIVSPR